MSDRVLIPGFVALWTSGYVVGALGVEVASPLPLLLARFTLASLALVPLAWPHRRDAPLGKLAVLGLFLQIAQFGGVYGGFALGVPPALSALVMLGLSPLVTTGLAVASGQEHADPRLWTGLGVGVLGVAISLAPELGDARVGAGVALTLIAMFGLAGGTVLQKRWIGHADARVSAAAQNVTAAVIMAPVVAVFGGHVEAGVQLAWTIAWIGLVMGVASLLVFMRVLRGHAASSVAALLLVVPAVTAIASSFILGETLHPASVVGMLVAMTAVGSVLQREALSRRTG